MIKIGIVGLGNTIGIASMHIKGYLGHSEIAQITALYDILPHRANEYKEKFGLENAVVCDSYEQFLGLVDAVSICTPNSTHVSLTVQALQAGKHVLCEKPFGVNAKECEEALKWAELSQRVCMIGLCYRGIPAFRYMKELIDEGFLGNVYYMRASQGGGRISNPDVRCEWRMQKELSGPGAVADFGSHMLDMTDWLLRDTCGTYKEVQCMEGCFIPQRLSVKGDVMKPVTNDDVAIFTARMESGVLCSFTASRIGCDHTLEIYGSKGYLGFNGLKPFSLMVQQFAGNSPIPEPKKEMMVPDELYKKSEAVPINDPFGINFFFEIEEFLDSIKEQTPATTGFDRGMYIQKLIDDLQRSSDEGSVVAVDYTK